VFYVSPFEVRDLACAFRMRRYDQVAKLLSAFAQEWLERGAVGLEVLGSEPLALLIREHVLDGTETGRSDPAAGFVEMIKGRGIQFIATATNLTRGRLDQLHIPPTCNEQKARLIEALLASSAFPAVFRPRWTWEVAPEANVVEQYIDGGVMDNLPLDAVARFLDEARRVNKVAARPTIGGNAIPHLLFTASLEVERPVLSDEATVYTAKRWLEAQRRAKELNYNNKIDGYAQTQRDLRTIWNADGRAQPGRFVPLDLEVVAVKPQWLCGTFAFHPMLGFRRADQARSIAHGCKTTLEAIHRLGRTNPAWIAGWKIAAPTQWSETANRENEAKGECWYRSGCQCPFSRQGLANAGSPSLAPNTHDSVERIYHLCGKKKTHARRDPHRLLTPAREV
jgi:predicted acylesterase/phospholipase RssA